MDDAMPRITAARALYAIFRTAAIAALATLALAAAAPGALAQQIVVFVNGDPITNIDVEQRAKLIQLTTQRAPPRQAVLDELIEERLKLQLQRRYKIDDMEKDVDNAYANMARRMRTTPQQLTAQLAKSGLKPDTLKSRIRAEIIWNQVIRGRFQASLQISDHDIMARLDTRQSDAPLATGYDYTLRPILFIVPRGSPPATVAARQREAEALRGRFLSCEQGLALARGMRDVAVRRPVRRTSADLQPELRSVLEKTEVGRLTAPEVTMQGVEIYAVCDKKPASVDDMPGKREAREKIFKERFDARSQDFLKELRSQAMIEFR
jgi:peptidyl-prolyl cis-trans isomerase SurA